MTLADTLNLRGIADLAGVPYETAATWRKRSLAALKEERTPRVQLLPPADALDDPPRWYRSTVVDWLTATARLPEPR